MLLNILYLLLLVGFSPVLLLRVLRGKYRRGMAERFFGRAPILEPKSAGEGRGPRVWFQAVSVGEVNLLRPILRELKQQAPDWEAVVSSTSQTGYDLAHRLFPDLPVFRCPLDFTWSVRRALKAVDPDLLVLVELELWPNLIREAKKRGVKTAIVNGRISDRSFPAYRRIRFFLKGVFRSLDRVMSGSAESGRRFVELGLDEKKLRVTGSIKFDGAQSDRANEKTMALSRLAGITPEDKVFLAGSTQAGEEAMALAAYRALAGEYPNLRLIVVPRHPERFEEVAETLSRSGVPFVRRSALEDISVSAEQKRVLLVDTIGELGAWWGTASIAFVGGSMGSRGGQNMLEPAAYGAAVSFGPNTRNFREIAQGLLAADAARVVHDGEEMTGFVRRCLADSRFAEGLGQRARELVKAQKGATAASVRELVGLVRD